MPGRPPRTPKSPTTRRTRDDWVRAAMIMGSRVGYENLAVEPLAAEVGATKGSFYWHFRDRAELIDAVVEDWAEESTNRVIALLEQGSATDALERLVGLILGDPDSDRLEWRILSSTDHPQIGPVVARVHEVRVDYVRRLLQQRGLSAGRARARARALYAAYLGHLALLQAPGFDRPVPTVTLRRELIALADAP